MASDTSTQGLVLYAKLLEQGRFVWPAAEDGAVSMTPAQLSTDDEAAKAVVRRNRDTQVPGERASLPRLLTAVGRVDGELIALYRARLADPAKGSFVTAGYDWVTDGIRPVPHALLDVVSSSHGL